MDRVNPCYGCGIRTAGCHSLCLEYQEWAKANEEKRKQISRENRARAALDETVIRRVDRYRKKRRKYGNGQYL